MGREEFLHHIGAAAREFLSTDGKEVVRLISHLDSDGISSASIMVKALQRLNRKYSLTIIPQLDKKCLEELQAEEYSIYIFSDLGSAQLDNIGSLLKGKKVFILDHHEIKDGILPSNCVHVNPHLFGIDGGKEISGAGVVFFFAKDLDNKNVDLAPIAIIGAIGDVQEDKGFIGMNTEILNIAQEQGLITVEKGLRFFGIKTRPVHKLLEYSYDPFLPGISGSESGAIQFLHDCDIEPKHGTGWKLYDELTPEEKSRLITGIILKRDSEERPEDVFGYHYHLVKEEFSSLQDAKEFSTLLNACGRLNKASLGIGACIGSKQMKKKAVENLNEYKKEIVSAINWYNEHKDTSFVVEGKGFLMVNAQDNILHTIIGTLASILSKSNEIDEGTYILCMAHTRESKIKVSLRVAGNYMPKTDVRTILSSIVDKTGGETGGHSQAAGAIIDIEKEEEFLQAAQDILSQQIEQEYL